MRVLTDVPAAAFALVVLAVEPLLVGNLRDDGHQLLHALVRVLWVHRAALRHHLEARGGIADLHRGGERPPRADLGEGRVGEGGSEWGEAGMMRLVPPE